MYWVLFSITAALIFTIVKIINKYILTKWIKNPVIPIIAFGIAGLLVTTFIYFFQGFEYLSYLNTALALLAGILIMLAGVLYFKAIKIEEISKIVPLFFLSPLFVLILGAIFLGEIFNPITYLGIFLLVTGTIILSTNLKKIKFSKALFFMVVATLLLAITAIIKKYLLCYADFWTVFAYTRIGTIFVLIPLLYFNYSNIMSAIKIYKGKAVGMTFLNQSLDIIGILFITMAMAIHYVTLVKTLVSVQVFFVLLFTIILSIFYPKILKEKISKSIIITKVIATALMFAGMILII